MKMPQSLKFKSRMDAVQTPIVPVVGDIIRQVPGTISLGQGVVHYGPPREAIEAARAALDDPATHEYQDGSRPAGARRSARGEASRARTASTSRAAAASW